MAEGDWSLSAKYIKALCALLERWDSYISLSNKALCKMATLTPEGLQSFVGALGGTLNLESSFAEICNNPMEIYLRHLSESLVQLTQCEPQVAHKSISWANDLSNVMVVAPRLRIKDIGPEDLAADLQQRFPPSPFFGHPVNDGINLLFYFSGQNLGRLLLSYILDRGSFYGKRLPLGSLNGPESIDNRKKILVEFSSPNVGQEFSGLHLRSTIVGSFVAGAYESMGWDVCRMTFIGDWGPHIGLLAAAWPRFGSEEAFEADPLGHLLEIHARAKDLRKRLTDSVEKHATVEMEHFDLEKEKNDLFKKLEEGDPDVRSLWTRFRDASIQRYQELYARLGITFDRYSGESDFSQETVAEIETRLREQGVYKEVDDGWVIEFSKPEVKGGLGVHHVRSKNGTTGYLLRDVAAALERDRKYSFDKLIYVVAGRQTDHFQKLRKALELIGCTQLSEKIQHVGFGEVQGLAPKDGASGILLGDVLDQCKDATQLFLDTDPEVASVFSAVATGGPEASKMYDVLGMTNLMVDDLAVRRGGPLTINLDKLATAGSLYTGLTLQKWCVMVGSRVRGVVIDREDLRAADFSMFEGEDTPYGDVLRLLLQFPQVVQTSFDKLESANIMTFLFTLMDMLTAIWEEEEYHEAQAEGSSQSLAKLAFYKCVHQVLENGMKIVGLQPLEV